MQRTNRFGQPIGPQLPDWRPARVPPREPLEGEYCRLEPIDAAHHGKSLYEASAAEADSSSWTYMAYGPFASCAEYVAWLEPICTSADSLFFAVVDKATRHAAGVASYLRIAPTAGSIEVGHIYYAPMLRRSRAATEAMALMMQNAFKLGYRRYEWKCDALNERSRSAAERLGFVFEGVFRQATVYKGRSRDTAWYSVTDQEWPRLQAALEAWLSPNNFDEHGRQRRSLSEFRE